MPTTSRPLRFALRFALKSAPALLLAAPLAVQAAPVYSVTPLGTLGGSFGDVKALNNSGSAVGYALTAQSVGSAYVSRGGTMTGLQPAWAVRSAATGINNAGVVAGTAAADGFTRALTFIGNKSSDLGTLGGASSAASGINDLGQVAGTAERADGAEHAFRFTPEAGMTDLGTLGGASSMGMAINNSGAVVGRADVSGGNYHAFLAAGDAMVDLGTLGGNFSEAHGINDDGTVTGFSYLNGNANAHAFLVENGVMIDLDTLGGLNSYGYGLNNLGHAVGASEIAGGNALHAFLYSGGVMTDLNELVELEEGWILNYAADINDRGQIAALGCSGFGQCQGFLLTLAASGEAPEPSTPALILAGAGMLWLASRRRPIRPSVGRD